MPHSPEATAFIAPSICSLVHRFRFTFLGDLSTAGADFDRFLDVKCFLRLHGGMATQHTLTENTVSTSASPAGTDFVRFFETKSFKAPVRPSSNQPTLHIVFTDVHEERTVYCSGSPHTKLDSTLVELVDNW